MGRCTFPSTKTLAVMYVFPALALPGVIFNILAFATLLNSVIRDISTGLYLQALAVLDIVCLGLRGSENWALPVMGTQIPPFQVCNIKLFVSPIVIGLRQICVACVTTDRLLSMLSPSKPTNRKTKSRARNFLLFVSLVLAILYLPALFAVDRNCSVQPRMATYMRLYRLFDGMFSFCAISIYLLLLCPVMLYKLAVSYPSRLSRYGAVAAMEGNRYTVAMVLISVLVVTCYVPLGVTGMLLSFRTANSVDPLTEERVLTECRLLAVTGHTVNFCLYLALVPSLRHSLADLVKRCGGRKEAPGKKWEMFTFKLNMIPSKPAQTISASGGVQP